MQRVCRVDGGQSGNVSMGIVYDSLNYIFYVVITTEARLVSLSYNRWLDM